ncbi:MAG: hypothetical protein HY279_11620 [Nitrospinae bacterium]|nr:hypothetical protein [Nitrospinota bacterium]
MSSKWKIIIIFALFAIVILSVYLLGWGQRAAKRDAGIFIHAMRIKDFGVIFTYHAFSQKRTEIALKNPATAEINMKAIYDEQKALFDQAQPTNNLKEFWSEKFLLIQDMKYNITGVKMVEDIENPSSPIRERWDAVIEVDVEYTNKKTAPDLNGRVKNVTYLMRFVNSRNVARTWVVKPQYKRWLFKGIAVKEGSLVYW